MNLKIHELNRLDYGEIIRAVCFSQDGTTLAAGSDDCFIRLWNVKTG